MTGAVLDHCLNKPGSHQLDRLDKIGGAEKVACHCNGVSLTAEPAGGSMACGMDYFFQHLPCAGLDA